MADDKKIESKYAKKLVQRRREQGGPENPKPSPLYSDYVRPYYPVPKQGMGDFKPLPCENPKLVAKFKRFNFQA